MIDHLGILVSDYEASKRFYSRALAPLGITLITEIHGHCGFGRTKPEFWISKGAEPQRHIHIAFTADNRAQVDAFYYAALDAGGKDNGKPGIRDIYHANYYGAFVIDPNGHNLEAVCHKAA